MTSLTLEKNLDASEDSDMIIIRDPRATNISSKRMKSTNENNSTEKKSLIQTQFSCDFCEKYFLDSNTLKKHISQHSNNESNKGKNSNHVFPSSFDNSPLVRKEVENSWLEWKTKEFNGKNPPICGICFDQFEDLIQLKLHNKIHAKAKTLPQCRLCLTFQPALSDLNRHMISHVNKTSFTIYQIMNSTSAENKKKKEMWLRKHKPSEVKKCLKEIQKGGTNQNKNIKYDKQVLSRKHVKKVSKKDISTKSKEFSCDICFAKFTFASNRHNHKKKHGLSSTHECQLCKKIFNSAKILKAHEESHNLKGTVCHLCQKTFEKVYELHEHLRLRHANVIRSSFDLSIRKDSQRETMGCSSELKDTNVISSSNSSKTKEVESMITVKKELIDEDFFEASYNPILSEKLNDVSTNVNTVENNERQRIDDNSDSDVDWDDVVLDDSSDEAEVDPDLDMAYNDNIVGYSVEKTCAGPSQDMIGDMVYNDNIVGFSVKETSAGNSQDDVIDEENIDDSVQEMNLNEEEQAPDDPNVVLTNLSVEEALRFFSS